MSPRAIGLVTATILQCIADGRRYGADILEATGLGSGTVYKVLRRLERRGHVAGRWEDAGVAEADRRPRRRYYGLTEEGRAVLAGAPGRLGAERPGRALSGAKHAGHVLSAERPGRALPEEA